MATKDSSLDALRREIDAIDDAIHDALMRRSSLIGDIAKAKRGARTPLAMRPAREAEILRRLAERHRGALPMHVVARIWREMVNGATAQQGPFAVAVCAPEKSVGYWDMARSHFGSSTWMSLQTAAMPVLRIVAENPGTVGVLPLPQEGETDPWWLGLVTEAANGDIPRIVWRLPFFTSPAGLFERLEALAIAFIEPEPTGRDTTVLAIETRVDTSRASLLAAMQKGGLPARVMAWHEDMEAGYRVNLTEIDDFVTQRDPRLADLARELGDTAGRIVVLGAYPRPMSEEELAAGGAANVSG